MITQPANYSIAGKELWIEPKAEIPHDEIKADVLAREAERDERDYEAWRKENCPEESVCDCGGMTDLAMCINRGCVSACNSLASFLSYSHLWRRSGLTEYI